MLLPEKDGETKPFQEPEKVLSHERRLSRKRLGAMAEPPYGTAILREDVAQYEIAALPQDPHPFQERLRAVFEDGEDALAEEGVEKKVLERKGLRTAPNELRRLKPRMRLFEERLRCVEPYQSGYAGPFQKLEGLTRAAPDINDP